jgi:hypothetical protein
MIRDPKSFEAWSICPCRAHSVIMELSKLPQLKLALTSLSSFDNFLVQRIFQRG